MADNILEKIFRPSVRGRLWQIFALIIVLVIIVLLFGVGRIGKIAKELGGGIRAFRQGLSEEEPKEQLQEKKES